MEMKLYIWESVDVLPVSVGAGLICVLALSHAEALSLIQEKYGGIEGLDRSWYPSDGGHEEPGFNILEHFRTDTFRVVELDAPEAFLRWGSNY